VRLYDSHTLIVDSGASAFGNYLLQRSCQIPGTPDFIDQPKPFASFNPRFQGCQPAFGPDRRFHPCPPGSDVSPLLSLFRHCRGLLFHRSVRFPFLASPLRSRLANASGRIEFIILFMDWSFTSGCSPPRLSATQLPSATDRPVFLSDRDFHPTVGAYSQAHFFNRFAVSPTGSERSCRSKMPLRQSL
jgi:hypothetical protein